MVARSDLHSLGFASHWIENDLRTGLLNPIWPHTGVYSLGHQSLTQRGWWMAAVLAAGPTALLSHRAAAAAWGLLQPIARIDVLRPRSGNFKPKGFRLRQTRTLEPSHYAVKDRIPVTSIPRTLADIAGTETIRTLEQAVSQAETMNRLRLSELDPFLLPSPGRRGASRLRTVVQKLTAVGHTESEAERLLLSLILSAGLPRPQTQVEIFGYRVDFVWVDRKLVAEADGWGSHGGRDAFQADRRRDRNLQAAGYRVLRFTWWDLAHHPRAVVSELRSLLTPIQP